MARVTAAMLVLVVALACLSGAIAEDTSEKAASFCEKKELGLYIDQAEPRCFFFCNRSLDGTVASSTPAYRSCCAESSCYTLPSRAYPAGKCGLCGTQTATVLTARDAALMGTTYSFQLPLKAADQKKLPSFAGGPLRRPSFNPKTPGGSKGKPADYAMPKPVSAMSPSGASQQKAGSRGGSPDAAVAAAPAPLDLFGAMADMGKEVGGLWQDIANPGTYKIPGVTVPIKPTPQVPINSVSEFSGLTEKQLFDIFTNGVADIPSDLPGERGKFAICNRTNTLLPNSLGYRPIGFENTTIPFGDEIFNLFQQVWHGKVMYTDPSSGNTHLWNLLMDQNTVDVLATVQAMSPGISKDKNPSVVVDYGISDIPAARIIRDEMRRVGPVTWLGRAFFINPILAALPTSKDSQLIVKALEPFTNMSEIVVDVISDLANLTAATPITIPPRGFLPITLWFSCECQSYFAPKLHYFPLLAEPLTFIQRLTGYTDPLYDLPSLTGPSGVDPNAATLPQKNTSDVDPFVLWPYNLSDPKLDGLENIKGFLQLPAKIFTRLFGMSWLPNLPAKGGWNPVLPPRAEGFAKGQASLADTMVFNRGPSATIPDTPDNQS